MSIQQVSSECVCTFDLVSNKPEKGSHYFDMIKSSITEESYKMPCKLAIEFLRKLDSNERIHGSVSRVGGYGEIDSFAMHKVTHWKSCIGSECYESKEEETPLKTASKIWLFTQCKSACMPETKKEQQS